MEIQNLEDSTRKRILIKIPQLSFRSTEMKILTFQFLKFWIELKLQTVTYRLYNTVPCHYWPIRDTQVQGKPKFIVLHKLIMTHIHDSKSRFIANYTAVISDDLKGY